jgi:hypothetical protein
MNIFHHQPRCVRVVAVLTSLSFITACGGGGGDVSAIGTVTFPSVRALPSPSGSSQLSSANDALLWARASNTAVDFNELVNTLGLGLFTGFLNGLSSVPVGGSFSTNFCDSGSVSISRFKQISFDISVGDYYQATYNSCTTSGYTFSGTVRAELVGALASGSVATRYTATNFGYVENATSDSYSNINAVVNHAFNTTLSAYSASGTVGTYFSPTAGTLTQNGSYTVNNAVVSSTLNGDIVAQKRFSMDVVYGALNLKLDTETPLIYSVSTVTSGNVQALNTGFISRVRISPNGANSSVSLDASNDGFYESSVNTVGQLVF